MTLVLAVAIAALAVAVLVLAIAWSLLAHAKELRREASSVVKSTIAQNAVERDKLLDRVATYDGKPRLDVEPSGETYEPDVPEGVTAQVESVLYAIENGDGN